MDKIMGFLDGKKTYIVAALAAVAIGLNLAGIIDKSVMEMVLTALGVTGVATLRDAIGKPPA